MNWCHLKCNLCLKWLIPRHKYNVFTLLPFVVWNCCLQASAQHLFSRLHYWLLLSREEPSSDSVLQQLYLPLDSHVTVAHGVSGHNQTVLWDIYHVGVGQSMTVTAPRHWSPGLQLPAGPPRTDYGGITIPTVVVVCAGTVWAARFSQHIVMKV